jgi:GMP synthase PP-ATPase subunit/isopentenyldiphosphate isomerase
MSNDSNPYNSPIPKTKSPFKFLAQGTLYPDVVESSSSKNSKSEVIKSHHNVGGLPEDMEFKLIEPLRDLFKDEVRIVGSELGLPDSIIGRHPFPGPGLAIRIMGEITPAKLQTLREADDIFIKELKNTLTEKEASKQELFGSAEFWQGLDNGAKANGRTGNIHALIFNSKGELFLQHRSSTKKIFPNIWEASVYGKKEENEDLNQTLKREITEETGWKVKRIVEYFGYTDWNINQKMVTDSPDNYTPQRTFTFVVEVEGDLSCPTIETGKADDYRWISHKELIENPDFFEANELADDNITTKMVNKFFDELTYQKSKNTNLYSEVWQAFCVLTGVQTVGVMGDSRTYESVLSLRAVTAIDGMTADWARLPYEFLAKVSNRIINEVRGVNRVVYDISSKPPATIEWE